MQAPVPLQPPPDHPVKVEPASAIAVNVTAVLSVYDSVQSAPQFMPEGELVTVPAPVPVLVTVNVYTGGVTVI